MACNWRQVDRFFNLTNHLVSSEMDIHFLFRRRDLDAGQEAGSRSQAWTSHINSGKMTVNYGSNNGPAFTFFLFSQCEQTRSSWCRITHTMSKWRGSRQFNHTTKNDKTRLWCSYAVYSATHKQPNRADRSGGITPPFAQNNTSCIYFVKIYEQCAIDKICTWKAKKTCLKLFSPITQRLSICIVCWNSV